MKWKYSSATTIMMRRMIPEMIRIVEGFILDFFTVFVNLLFDIVLGYYLYPEADD